MHPQQELYKALTESDDLLADILETSNIDTYYIDRAIEVRRNNVELLDRITFNSSSKPHRYLEFVLLFLVVVFGFGLIVSMLGVL